MSSATKLAAYVAVVAVAFGGAAAVGATVGPIDVGGADHPSMTDAAGTLPGGVAVAASGYRLVVDTAEITPGTPATFGFTIVDDRGAPVTHFDELHERRLHLIVLSRDLVGFHHVHPAMDASGHWSVDLPALTPGSHRVFADFAPSGATNITLGADISVAGALQPLAVPAPAATFAVDDYVVALGGTPKVGDTELQFTVERGAQTVTTDPYLGAAGHLVAIRQGDLAYLHVHPHGDGAPTITFTADFPTAGTYRLFLDFAHDGVVRTAAFTVNVPDGAAPPAPMTPPTHAGGH
jgi:hypothetical protein